MEEFLRDLGIAIIGGIVAGLLSPAVIFILRQRYRQGQEVRILRAFMTLSEGRPDLPILERRAAEEAKIDDYVPIVERLCRRGEVIASATHPGYYGISPEGRQRASERRWWEFWR